MHRGCLKDFKWKGNFWHLNAVWAQFFNFCGAFSPFHLHGIIFYISSWQYCQSLIQIFTTTYYACIKLHFRWNLNIHKGLESIHLNIAECIGYTDVAVHAHSPWRHVLCQHCSHDYRALQSRCVSNHFVWAVGECCRLFQVFVLHHFWSTLGCSKDVGPGLYLYYSKQFAVYCCFQSWRCNLSGKTFVFLFHV